MTNPNAVNYNFFVAYFTISIITCAYLFTPNLNDTAPFPRARAKTPSHLQITKYIRLNE